MYSVVNKALTLTLLAVSWISAPIPLPSQGRALDTYKEAFLTLFNGLPKLAV